MTMPISLTPPRQAERAPSRWQAELALGLAATPRGTVLRACHHQGPLYVQKPFYPEGRDLAHLYLLHPPGGLVSGDKLQIDVTLAPKAQALLTTPGAGRIYRARADKTLQQQLVTLRLEEDSTLEWLPLETILYPGAATRLDTCIHLCPQSRFIGWEVTCLGLPASGQSFTTGALQQRLQITLAGRLALRERLVIEEPAPSVAPALTKGIAGLRTCPVNGLMVAGPFFDVAEAGALVERLRELAGDLHAQGDASQPMVGISLNDSFLLIRYLGHCAEQSRGLFTRLWAEIRPALIGRPPCSPRIWAT